VSYCKFQHLQFSTRRGRAGTVDQYLTYLPLSRLLGLNCKIWKFENENSFHDVSSEMMNVEVIPGGNPWIKARVK